MLRSSEVDLILPAGYDILWIVVASVAGVLLIAATVVWFRTDFRGVLAPLVWAWVLLAVPVFGSIAFLRWTWSERSRAQVS